MTFDEYILNPIGKRNAVLNASTREILRSLYKQKFDNILLRERGKINYKLYKQSTTNVYWAHIKVPSEVVPKFYYDVVIKFFADENVRGGGANLFKYSVQFFSNDPAFIYNYAYSFNQRKLFITELKKKMGRKILSTPAKEKNPDNIISYVKSIYFAYLTIENLGLNKLHKFESECKELNPRELLKDIEDPMVKIKKREELGSKISKKKKKIVSKTELDNIKKYTKKNQELSGLQVRNTKTISGINISKKSGSVSGVRKTKRK